MFLTHNNYDFFEARTNKIICRHRWRRQRHRLSSQQPARYPKLFVPFIIFILNNKMIVLAADDDDDVKSVNEILL